MIDSNASSISEFHRVIWGDQNVKSDIFQRWCQGFCFSSFEPSALIQNQGGPCAILATVQANIMREIIFNRKQNVSDITDADNMDVLFDALLNIIRLVSPTVGSVKNFTWVSWAGSEDSLILPSELATPCPDTTSLPNQETANEDTLFSAQHFFKGLKLFQSKSEDEFCAVALSLLPQLRSNYGVLCFLYSVLLSHGLQSLRTEMGDELEPLIDPIHGHASQCLINLLITGQAIPYLFDGERDLGGFNLKGLTNRPPIGFLTLLESLNYCEVGWFLKNPSFPIWVLGSETHLTVLASLDNWLVSDDLPTNQHQEQTKSELSAIRQIEIEFQNLSPDPDTGGFISSEHLQQLLTTLNMNLTSEEIDELNRKLDPESLGIILRDNFLRHFYPNQMEKQRVDTRKFRLFHYNGLERSNEGNKVQYHLGEAHLIDPTDELVEIGTVDQSPIQKCLMTKWPTIRIQWTTNRSPSLN